MWPYLFSDLLRGLLLEFLQVGLQKLNLQVELPFLLFILLVL
jgi:hypothetical protein